MSPGTEAPDAEAAAAHAVPGPGEAHANPAPPGAASAADVAGKEAALPQLPALTTAARAGDLTEVKRLLAAGGDAAEQDDVTGVPPLYCSHWFAVPLSAPRFSLRCGMTASKWNLRENRILFTGTATGKHPGSRDGVRRSAGTSALMAAAAGGHALVAAALLEAGAPWNAVDRRRRCAGDLAMARDDFDTANLLLDAGGPSHATIFLVGVSSF